MPQKYMTSSLENYYTTCFLFPYTIAIHFDSKNYSNPHSWDPDHFSKEAKGNRNP